MARRRSRGLELTGRLIGLLVWSALALVSVLALVPLGLPHLLPWLAGRHGVELAVGRASYTLPGPDLRLEAVRLGGAGGPLELREVRVGLRLGALLRGELRLARLLLEGGRVTLDGVPGAPRLRLAPDLTLALGPIDDLEAVDLTVITGAEGLPAVRLGSARVQRTPADGAQASWSVAGEGTLGDGTFRLSGEVEPRDQGIEAQGQVALRRLDLAGLRPVLGRALEGLSRGLADGELAARAVQAPGGAWVVEGEGWLEVDELALAAPGAGLSEARLRWEGRATAEGAAEGALALRGAGRLDLDRAQLQAGAGAGRTALLLRGVRLDGQASVAGTPGDWSLDGDGQAARVEVRHGPWAGLTLTDLSAWGLWHRAQGELSVGQLRVGQAEFGPGPARERAWPRAGLTARVQDVEVRGLSSGAEGLTVDRLATGPASLAAGDGLDPIDLAALEVLELVVTPAWSRAGSVELTGLSIASATGEGELRAERLTAMGVQATGDEPVRLGELRAAGVHLALTRTPDGRWPPPAFLAGREAGFTLDSLIVGQGSTVRLSDPRAEPRVRVVLGGLEARVSAWEAGHTGRFSARAEPEGGGSIELAGELRPWPELGVGPIQARFSGIPLSLLAGYIRAWLGVEALAGQLDGQLALHGPGARQPDQALLVVSAAELATPAVEPGRGTAVRRALRVIEDRRGRSELSLPLAGDSPPGERLWSALRAAASRVGRPLGLDDGGVTRLLEEGSVPLRTLHPADDPAVIPAAEAAFLEALAARLRPLPGLRVRLCPAAAAGADPLGEAGRPDPASTLEAVRERLVAGNGLGAEQVVSCPGQDRASATGAVVLTLEVRP